MLMIHFIHAYSKGMVPENVFTKILTSWIPADYTQCSENLGGKKVQNKDWETPYCISCTTPEGLVNQPRYSHGQWTTTLQKFALKFGPV